VINSLTDGAILSNGVNMPWLGLGVLRIADGESVEKAVRWALETGYYITPDLRVGVGYSFGSVDDRDFTGYRSEGGPYLNVTFKVNELFGGFGRQKVAPPPQQEESQVQPVADNQPAANPTSEE